MFFPKEKNYDDINEVRTAITAILEQYSDNPELARQLVADSECRIFDIIPLNDDSTAWFFGYGYADYALRLDRNPVTRRRELRDIVAMPLYDDVGAGFYAQVAAWNGCDLEHGQQLCRRLNEAVSLLTLPQKTVYDHEACCPALSDEPGWYAVRIEDGAVAAVEPLPEAIVIEQRDCLSAATAVLAAICSGAEAEEAFPRVGIEFLCPPVLLPLATLGFKRCLHIVWQEAAYMVTIEGHRLLHIVKI
ncbi:hypothetical protein [Cardiobacterium hominis]|uniref:hypothetical protein n=1 Tax=Cardiobacterium hominis TaxID=2718 RepID=UPI0028D6028C|nr:hypothetical protein [Cardiobacterium hominis]